MQALVWMENSISQFCTAIPVQVAMCTLCLSLPSPLSLSISLPPTLPLCGCKHQAQFSDLALLAHGQGDEADNFYIVESGQVRVMVKPVSADLQFSSASL